MSAEIDLNSLPIGPPKPGSIEDPEPIGHQDPGFSSAESKGSTGDCPNGASRDPIAIIGIGCRFPGSVAGPESFWRLLLDKVDAIGEIPADRIDVNTYYDPRPASPGKMTTRWGGFLDGIDMFDAGFFGISPREADRIDPQQRLLLEVAWEALEDAGQPADRLAGADAGVFIGLCFNDYEARALADTDKVDFYMTTGTGRYFASGRLSYFLGIQGPSLTVDTGCSSSLVTVHLACQSLWRNECSMALAGGANIILQPHIAIAFSQSKMMSPEGRCKFGDTGANGYVRSEGAGIVVLKPLAAALKEGDPIYAVIQGSAVNNDGGRSGRLAAPARAGHEDLLRRAYRDAKVSPGRVRYVEAHGTGTIVGDRVEIGALASVLSSDRDAGKVCYVGSVKTNFGHTEGASGIAGLIKAALVLKHRTIPASLHLKELNPAISGKDHPLAIPSDSIPWPQDQDPAIAGVNSFGIAGTNAHLVLAEAPREQTVEKIRLRPESAYLLPLSAQSPEALRSMARAWAAVVSDETLQMHDICFTASLRRTHHQHRAALVAASREEMVERLIACSQGESIAGVSVGRTEPDRSLKVVFVCPGQGSQWVGMGRQLMRCEAVFRESLQRCDQAMRPFVDWSLYEQLNLDPDEPGYRMSEIDVIQPVLVSIEIALGALWRSWGVEADAVVGHSMGEVAAAYLAGALSLDDAMRIICKRSALLRGLSGKGAMALVALPIDQANEALAGLEDRASVAVSNSPRSTVLSGEPAVISEIVGRLQSQDIFCRFVNVDVASHSPQMDALTQELSTALDGIEPKEAKIPIYSTVTAERINGSALDSSYWINNLRRPVLFARTVQRLVEEEHTVFVELSPHPILLSSMEETVGGLDCKASFIPSLERRKDEPMALLASVGRLYALGYLLNWKSFYSHDGKVVALPAYPWQREHYWMDTRPARTSKTMGSRDEGIGSSDAHPLLGVRLPDIAGLPDSMHWQNELRAPGIREFLGERHLGNSPLPEALYVEMVSVAAKAAFGEKLHRVSDWKIHRPLILEESANPEIQFVLTVNKGGFGSFQIFSREGSRNNLEPASKSKWMPLVSGEIEAGQAEARWLYELEWKRKPRVPKRPEAPARRTEPWLVFADRGGLGLALAESLETRGESCVLVFAGDSFQKQSDRHFSVAPGRLEDVQQLREAVLGREDPSCRGMIYLWGLDAVSTDGMTAAGLKGSQSLISDGALPLIRSLTRTESNPAPRLWLATRGAQDVEPGDGLSLSVAQAPLWGLGRVIALEHPEVWGGLVDLPSSGKTDLTEAETAMALCDEILGPDGEDQVALRGRERYVLRLVRSHSGAVVSRPLVLSPDATYLITGGLGALGLSVADWLFKCGARHFILMNRTGLPERSEWRDIPEESAPGKRIAAVQDLEGRGAKVHVVKADVSDESQMSGLREELHRHPPLRGIIHAAGIVTSRDLVDLSANEYHEILRSKVSGAWLLHQLAASIEAGLDLFVMFSSAAAILGSRGLAHYAAANHFLDALAHYRAAHGLPALSVNWGWWLGGGMVTEEFAARFGDAGLKGIPPAQALSVLGYLLETDATQKMVADIDWTVLGTVIESKRNRPLLEQLATRSGLAGTEGGVAKQTSRLAEQIRQAAPIERQLLLEEFIRAQVADLLGFATSKSVDPKLGFFKMGMDSIMTVQLRTRLESSLGCSLPPTVAFEFPSAQGLARFLAETVIQPEKPPSTAVVAPVVAPALEESNGAAKVSREILSEEELADLLEKKLAGFR